MQDPAPEGRRVTHRYADPLDAIWLSAARHLGFEVRRAADVYASSDGRGTLTIGTPETLDADDSLAQMILHELCHALVEGPERFAEADWGLDNVTDRHRGREHACLRLQAALADAHGLRDVLAPTTDFRSYYDALPRTCCDPSAGAAPEGAADDEAEALARAGLARAEALGWTPTLERALAATARIVQATRDALEALGPAAQDDARDLPWLFERLAR
ncbi:MAG: hypothetical protein KC543_16285 [Myxococcales bacterium]|nr:hypothetical protein [Myxococcales bacterium]